MLEHIELLNLDASQEYLVNGLVSGLISPFGFSSCGAYDGYRVRYFDTKHWIFTALNEIMAGYGVECIPHPNENHGNGIAEYINMGDTYTPTIVLCDGEFEVNSWGDFYEGWLQEQGEFGLTQCPNCSRLSSDFTQTGFSDNCPLCNYPVIEHETFTLRYEAGEQVYTLTLESAEYYERGRQYVKYSLNDRQGVIFSGSDLGIPAHQTAESKETARALLDFLTLQKGDTDDEYFENYTPRQLAFRDGPAEEVSLWGYDLEEELSE